MPAGRHTKRTPETEAKLFQALSLGATRKAACEYVGIGVSTLHDWCTEFPEFSEALTQAEAKAEMTCVASVVSAAAKGDWRAGESWLKRRRREEWGDRQEVVILRQVVEEVQGMAHGDLLAWLGYDGPPRELAAGSGPEAGDSGGAGPA